MEEKEHDQEECPDPGRSYRPFLLLVLFFSLYLSYLILEPFFHTLVFAIVLASLFYPIQLYLTRLYRGRKNLAALTVIFIITFLIALPTFFFASALVTQGLDSINRINEWIKSGNLDKITEDPRFLTYSKWVEERLTFVKLDQIDIASNILQLSKNLGQFLLSKGATILGNVATLISHFFVMIFIVFYVVRDGHDMLEKARYLSPLRKDQEDRILGGVRVVARSVLLGTFLTALSQGLVGGIGLALVGIPGLFWGTVMGFASLIPLIGTALVWVPSVGYLLLFGSWKSAVFLALWCIILVGSIDNFLRPFLMRGGSAMSPFYIFLAIIGGVQYFGLAGILYGPLILSFAMIMLYIYGVEYREDLLGAKKQTLDSAQPEGDK
jgi:predicted PurR-regulated permease PerM